MHAQLHSDLAVGPATPMKPHIDRQIAIEIVSLLRAEGLMQGKSRVVDRSSVEVPLAVKHGTEPRQLCEALRATHPQLRECVVNAIDGHIQVNSAGQLMIQLPLRLRLAAIQCMHLANTGSMYSALV